MTTDTYISFAAAKRQLGVSDSPLEKIRANGLIRQQGKRLHAEDVDKYAQVRSRKTYVSGEKNISGRIGFAAPVNDPALGSSMFLSSSNGRADAVQGLVDQGMSLGAGQEVTGWWTARDSMVEKLVDEKSIILGVTGGFVRQAARVVAFAASDDGGRRAFLVLPIVGAELDALLGYVPRMNQTGVYVQL